MDAQSTLNELRERVMAAHQQRHPLRLRGAGTKDFYRAGSLGDASASTATLPTSSASATAQLGGTITGEHGVGIEKINSMCVQFSDAERAAFFNVKAAFDATGLLNPGKAIPTLARCSEYGKMHVHAGALPHADIPRF